MDDIQNDVAVIQDLDETSKSLKRIPPGFTRGLRLPGDEQDEAEDLLSDIRIPHKAAGGDIPVRGFD